MRIYIPLTATQLKRLASDGELTGEDGAPLAANAVTGAVREWYTEGDEEELEYTAMTEAAEACLHLLAADPQVPWLRIVAAADVPDTGVTPGGDFRSSLTLKEPLALKDVASFHVDEAAAEPVVTAAIEALGAAANGDEDARFLLDEAEAADLLWYDVTEIDDVSAAVAGSS